MWSLQLEKSKSKGSGNVSQRKQLVSFDQRCEGNKTKWKDGRMIGEETEEGHQPVPRRLASRGRSLVLGASKHKWSQEHLLNPSDLCTLS